MLPVHPVWVSNRGGTPMGFPGGVFTDKAVADEWILRNKLTAVLAAYPLNRGCRDWAIANHVTSMKPETLEQKRRQDHRFIGSFSTASQEHVHYEDGVEVGRR